VHPRWRSSRANSSTGPRRWCTCARLPVHGPEGTFANLWVAANQDTDWEEGVWAQISEGGDPQLGALAAVGCQERPSRWGGFDQWMRS
jgi:hypothetical protein